ncbi:F-box protein FBW2-like isoform X2 [Phragmites australis]|uniref:F-box protein FBW2-like isoform X2 n=1 Tax=Phragmites australis TaxID=29695 RepID=UPI002D79C190|nr:F-box protein FBW2-like isoform X2 [Phragmites australis]XP_062220318.1 F-box protein FBW2-like isoform X2 [Phragmites australis]XP_062220319.1 F-box protein FBW2-like isoform X2 [Phragmites australis]XP_062220320.1 F-box protein FBW2-like isoform X2 [Phragmites australis]XP_062220321.1 F-box protein FBW2-like isoform X2 [Phragmites australis]XP_062220322.1 F-box protein FBW2-like isoform X2 [Phragmites australis]XP_062220323.1 F-box protein FBW2-like isoform X2 [Phragmites australis]XP_0
MRDGVRNELGRRLMGDCEDAKEYRCWEELFPDALGLIFRNLPLQEVLTVLPRVCKSWGRVVAGPYCWQEIDIEEWSQQQSKPEQIGRMVELLVGRSGGSCRRISVSGLPCDPLFSFIGDHARALRTLEIPRSEISDNIVETVAPRLSNVTFLDISSCTKIGARALEAFGKHCKSLVGLRRVMHPIDLADKVCQHDEAHAIACSMPKLRHLEMGYMLITTEAVLEILAQCRDLKFLDLRGCWTVDDKFLRDRHPGLRVLGPRVDDCYENSYWEECSDYSDSSIYSWEFMDDVDDYYAVGSDDEAIWDDGQGLENLEVRFYGGGFSEGYAGFDWPPSP